jgi:hypothetical protein
VLQNCFNSFASSKIFLLVVLKAIITSLIQILEKFEKEELIRDFKTKRVQVTGKNQKSYKPLILNFFMILIYQK